VLEDEDDDASSESDYFREAEILAEEEVDKGERESEREREREERASERNREEKERENCYSNYFFQQVQKRRRQKIKRLLKLYRGQYKRMRDLLQV
jgi:hypothetical protein